MSETLIKCRIEHHATFFALLAKSAITICGEEGKEAILNGMTRYGNERGARMAANALKNGDEISVFSNQLYGEWEPEEDDHMDCGFLRNEPTLQTYVNRCPWCEAWKKHDLLDYGKYYCVNVDKAVFQGFHPNFVCTPTTTQLSWGGKRCEFDWQFPLTDEEMAELSKRQEEIGSDFTKDFNFHTAHLYHAISKTLEETLGDKGKEAVNEAIEAYIELFGQEYFDILLTIPKELF